MTVDRDDAPLAEPSPLGAIPDDQPVTGLADDEQPGRDDDEGENQDEQSMPGIPKPGVDPPSSG